MHYIKVRENEFTPLLDREKARSHVLHAFPNQLATLKDLTNYGTNLIPRCYTSSDRDLKDVVVVGILLRQAVAMLDGVEVLMSNGAVYSAGLQARALFEASAYIEWILQSDIDTKAVYYYVHNVRRQRRWAKRFLKNSPEAAAFAASIPGGPLPSLHDPKVDEQAKNHLQNIQHVLSQPQFATVSKEFDQCAFKNGADRPWYFPFGIKSVSALIKTLGRTAEYTVFYGSWSEAMHSSNYAQHVKMGKGKVTFEPIRHLATFKTLFTFTTVNALRVFRHVLGQYRPDELKAFGKKYSENWKTDLLEVPDIRYEVISTDSI
jgi:hypothetical protein